MTLSVTFAIAPSLAFSLLACSNDHKLGRIPEAPTVELSTPEGADALRQGQGPLTIEGRVQDSFDEPDELALVWTTPLGETTARADATGLATLDLDLDALGTGPHRVRLTARDSDDLEGQDELDLVVWGPLGAPTVIITAPADNSEFGLGATISFAGQATDASTDPADLLFAWASDRDGALSGAVSSDGRSVLLADGLSAGSHRVSLVVTDTDGEVGTDTITVHIREDEPDPDPDPDPEPEPTDAEEGDLVFSEMMINPQLVADEVGEWVELYNTAGYPIEIAGYTFRDDDYDYWVLEGSMVVEPGEYFVLCADMDPGVNGGINCDGWFFRNPDTPGLALANGTDEVVLMRPDGVEIDGVRYTSSWFSAGASIGVDPSLLRSGNNDDPTHWCTQTTVLAEGREPATPGLENDTCF